MADLPFDGGLGLSSSPSLDEALLRWTADARVDQRVDERQRGRWLRQQATDDATFAGTLIDLAERGRPVGIHTAAGRRHRGTVSAVGVDFVLLRSMQGHDVLIPFDAVSLLRPEPGETATSGDRALTVDVVFIEALHELSHDRPRVLVVFRGVAESIAGMLRSVGRDIVTIGLDGPERSMATVPVVSIAEVTST